MSSTDGLANRVALWIGGGLLAGWLGGAALMAALLSSENKLGNPKHYGEFFAGTGGMAAMVILIAALGLSAHPLATSDQLTRPRMAALVFLTWLPIIAATVGVMNLLELAFSRNTLAAALPLVTAACAAVWSLAAADKIRRWVSSH